MILFLWHSTNMFTVVHNPAGIRSPFCRIFPYSHGEKEEEYFNIWLWCNEWMTWWYLYTGIILKEKKGFIYLCFPKLNQIYPNLDMRELKGPIFLRYKDFFELNMFATSKFHLKLIITTLCLPLISETHHELRNPPAQKAALPASPLLRLPFGGGHSKDFPNLSTRFSHKPRPLQQQHPQRRWILSHPREGRVRFEGAAEFFTRRSHQGSAWLLPERSPPDGDGVSTRPEATWAALRGPQDESGAAAASGFDGYEFRWHEGLLFNTIFQCIHR